MTPAEGARQNLNQHYGGGDGQKRLVNRFEVRLPTQWRTGYRRLSKNGLSDLARRALR